MRAVGAHFHSDSADYEGGSGQLSDRNYGDRARSRLGARIYDCYQIRLDKVKPRQPVGEVRRDESDSGLFMRVRAITCELELIAGRTEESDRSVSGQLAHASIRPSIRLSVGLYPWQRRWSIRLSQDNFH